MFGRFFLYFSIISLTKSNITQARRGAGSRLKARLYGSADIPTIIYANSKLQEYQEPKELPQTELEKRLSGGILLPLKISEIFSAKSKSDINTLRVFCTLKTAYYNGRIKEARSKAEELSSICGITERTWRTHLKKLESWEWIQWDGSTVCCVSWDKIKTQYGIKSGIHKIKVDPEEFISNVKLSAIKANERKQKYVQKRNLAKLAWIFDQEERIFRMVYSQNEGKERTPENNSPSRDQIFRAEMTKVKRQAEGMFSKKGMVKRYFKLYFPHEIAIVELQKKIEQKAIYSRTRHIKGDRVNLSIQGINKLFKTTSGQYWRNDLKNRGLVRVDTRVVKDTRENMDLNYYAREEEDKMPIFVKQTTRHQGKPETGKQYFFRILPSAITCLV